MKHSTQFPTIIFFLFNIVLFSACSTDANNVFGDPSSESLLEENGLTASINELVPDSILTEMRDLGMPIHTGNTPPNLEGKFFCSPLKLLASNISSDYVGQGFVNYTYTFYNQDQRNLSINVDYESSIDTSIGIGSFIVGSGDVFSIFVEAIATHTNGSKARFVYVLSGQMAKDGIQDLTLALFMIDNQGNQGGVWIENGRGRIINDDDAISERI